MRILRSANSILLVAAIILLHITATSTAAGKILKEKSASKHWAFIPPKQPSLPNVDIPHWPRNAIDYFVLARLEQEDLQPTPEATKETLIRRVTLDLTGLPATPSEVAAFLSDRSDRAYEIVVDRLLASPRYGESMALDWLDAARYADTSGYQTDGIRFMWRWRDWVINAFNNNVPFDQFTIEQLAGDLLPSPTLDQMIATGFNRNHRANSEGGIVFQEYLTEYAVDRVDTTSTVWLGLTIGCARCHDHKYDPVSQKEFYQLFAYFNQVPERGRVSKYGNSAPVIRAPTSQMETESQEIERALDEARADWTALRPELDRAQEIWETSVTGNSGSDEWVIDGLETRVPFDDMAIISRGESHQGIVNGGSLIYVQGQERMAAHFDDGVFLQFVDAIQFSGRDSISFGFWIRPDSGMGRILGLVNDADTRENGFSVGLSNGKVRIKFGPRWLDDAIRVETRNQLEIDRWQHLLITYNGSQMADGFAVHVNGVQQELTTLLDIFTGGISLKHPLHIGAGRSENGFTGDLDDLRFYRRTISADESRILATSTPIHSIAKKPASQRSEGEIEKIRRFFLDRAAPESSRKAFVKLQTWQRKQQAFEAALPTVMVMQDRSDPNATFILNRGEYDHSGEQVTAGVPGFLPPLPKGTPNNRLGLAQWLVQPSHPLTSRVAVNRYWQRYFGAGFVRTPEDFGVRGELPTHPELLDWLASEFVKTGWNIKELQRLIVTSATYRQSSDVTNALLKRDPENRLLARAPRMRLSAEAIRDQALAVSGLLDTSVGGPSVKPYQPANLWKEIASDSSYEQDHGRALYRRSLYTFWKRTVPPSSMAIFDAPSREICAIRRPRTNTPLQALALMNEVTYVEAARALAERMIHGPADSDEDRVRFGFRLLTARQPSHQELNVLSRALDRNRIQFRNRSDSAKALIAIGESKPDAQVAPAELAAYTLVANLMLNLDEVITKE